ncbi:MAG TPA: acetylxylan esterase [Phototrophicaceae bacterium]|jgi:cephalosporin-C deacetylase|nr:acetylxylan esterase [Phototrophicaceae bacterium]
MPFFDLSLEDLVNYTPPCPEPKDFDAFWAETLQEAQQYPLNATFVPYESGLKLIDAWDVTFAGYGGQPIKGWYIRPAGVTTPLPCIVEYIGYGGGRGDAAEWLFWANAGYAHFIMDTRGQGSSWRKGDTADIPDGANPSVPGFMTQGVTSPKTYYYRRVYTDAVRAIEAARTRSDVIGTKIAVTGGSQGGGISIAAAGLVPDVAICMPDVPFLCHFRRAVTLIDTFPYAEIAKYLVSHREKIANTMATLDYFDGINFSARIKAHSLYSVALMDTICPPSTVYAAYNHVSAPKDIRTYTFNNHEGGGHDQSMEKLKFVRDLWG